MDFQIRETEMYRGIPALTQERERKKKERVKTMMIFHGMARWPCR